MPTFVPPVDYIGQTTLPDRHPGNALFRHYGPRPVGRNVWKLTDGSYTELDPSDSSVVAHLYHGAHVHEVSAAEAASLTAAGYGSNIT